MPSEQSAGYLPGDPRYGLQGEALKDYYRTKPTQWAIYCWDKPGKEAARRTLVAEQNSYVKNFGERVIGYGHFISDDGRDTLGTSFFMQLDDRAALDKFVADEPMNKAGVLPARRNPPLVEQFPEACRRLRPKGPAAVPVHGTQSRHAGILPRAPARARIILCVVWRQLHLPRANPLGGWCGQYRHSIAHRVAQPRGCGQVLERGAVCQERRVSEGRAHHPVGVRGSILVADPRWRLITLDAPTATPRATCLSGARDTTPLARICSPLDYVNGLQER